MQKSSAVMAKCHEAEQRPLLNKFVDFYYEILLPGLALPWYWLLNISFGSGVRVQVGVQRNDCICLNLLCVRHLK